MPASCSTHVRFCEIDKLFLPADFPPQKGYGSDKNWYDKRLYDFSQRFLYPIPKFETLLRDWIRSDPNLIIAEEDLCEADMCNRMTFLGEMSPYIQNARLAFTNLEHLRRRRGKRVSIKGPM